MRPFERYNVCAATHISNLELDNWLCAIAHICVIVQREATACFDIWIESSHSSSCPFAQSAQMKRLVITPEMEDENTALQSRQRRHAQLHAAPLDVSPASNHASGS